MDSVDHLALGRQAFEEHEWESASQRLAGSDLGALEPADLMALATAAYLVGESDTSVRALQQSFALHVDRDETLAAAQDAFWLSVILFSTARGTVASGWAGHAQRLLAGEPDDIRERGYLHLSLMHRHVAVGDFPQADEQAGLALAVAQRHQDPSLLTMALAGRGRLRLYDGKVAEGLSLLDAAMAVVTAGAVHPILAGVSYCTMVEACQEIGDHQRMCDWTRALSRWCAQQPGLAQFTAQCALHRGQILRIDGDFAAALEELDRALQRYRALGQEAAAGQVHYERAEVLRIQGEQDLATVDFDAAAALGREPQPGLALLWLARGRTTAAVATVRRLLHETRDPVHRSQVLPAAVEVLVSAGDHEGAVVAAEELRETARRFGCSTLGAAASYADGTVALALGDPATALPALRGAWQQWLELGARYEAARARFYVGLAMRALGDPDSANAELNVAHRAFAQLGARTAQQQVEQALTGALPGGLTAREVEVLSLVAGGMSNRGIAADLVLSEKTVARHLSNIFTKLGVSSRTAAAAYAFEHDLV